MMVSVFDRAMMLLKANSVKLLLSLKGNIMIGQLEIAEEFELKSFHLLQPAGRYGFGYKIRCTGGIRLLFLFGHLE